MVLPIEMQLSLGIGVNKKRLYSMKSKDIIYLQIFITANENMDKAGEIVGNVNIYLDQTVDSYDIIRGSMKDLMEQFQKLEKAGLI
jgi:hypothetical protein